MTSHMAVRVLGGVRMDGHKARPLGLVRDRTDSTMRDGATGKVSAVTACSGLGAASRGRASKAGLR